jgi:NADH-quinone oxidoreductase subunit G
VGVLPDGANAVGGHLVGAVPSRGMDARAMVASPRAGYVVAGVEAELDMGPQALAALDAAEFTVALSCYRNATTDRAHVILPIGAFTETAGTFVNMEGRVQSFNAVAADQGDSRPGWKVLRMLGATLGLAGFHAERIEQVRAEIAPDLATLAQGRLSNSGSEFEWQLLAPSAGLQRIAEFGIYATDPIVRRSPALQRTADGKAARSIRIHPATAAARGLAAGNVVRASAGQGHATLPVQLDATVPEGCVRIARGVPETAALGAGELTLERVAEAAVA